MHLAPPPESPIIIISRKAGNAGERRQLANASGGCRSDHSRSRSRSPRLEQRLIVADLEQKNFQPSLELGTTLANRWSTRAAADSAPTEDRIPTRNYRGM
jgi:hypothetical protein